MCLFTQINTVNKISQGKMKNTYFDLFKNRKKYSSGVSLDDFTTVSQIKQSINVPILRFQINRIDETKSFDYTKFEWIYRFDH